MSGGYCAMSEHDDRFEELNGAIDSAIELLTPFVAGENVSEHQVAQALAILREVR